MSDMPVSPLDSRWKNMCVHSSSQDFPIFFLLEHFGFSACVCEHHRLLCDDAGPKQQKKCPLGQKSENWDVCAASETRGGILDPLRIFDFFDIRHE